MFWHSSKQALPSQCIAATCAAARCGACRPARPCTGPLPHVARCPPTAQTLRGHMLRVGPAAPPPWLVPRAARCDRGSAPGAAGSRRRRRAEAGRVAGRPAGLQGTGRSHAGLLGAAEAAQVSLTSPALRRTCSPPRRRGCDMGTTAWPPVLSWPGPVLVLGDLWEGSEAIGGRRGPTGATPLLAGPTRALETRLVGFILRLPICAVKTQPSTWHPKQRAGS